MLNNYIYGLLSQFFMINYRLSQKIETLYTKYGVHPIKTNIVRNSFLLFTTKYL